MMDRGARTFYSPLKRVSMKQGGKVRCTLLSTARANRVQSCSDLVCVRKITSSTNYSLGSMSGDAICKNRYTVRSVHLSEQGCTIVPSDRNYKELGDVFYPDSNYYSTPWPVELRRGRTLDGREVGEVAALRAGTAAMAMSTSQFLFAIFIIAA